MVIRILATASSAVVAKVSCAAYSVALALFVYRHRGRFVQINKNTLALKFFVVVHHSDLKQQREERNIGLKRISGDCASKEKDFFGQSPASMWFR